ncbi:MAG: hypothetical protein WCX95_04455, partial [Candidatus Gracilibacteria bacterium]
QKISSNNAKKLIGKFQKVLIENYDPKKKVYIGRSQRFSPEIDGNIIVESKQQLELNQFYKVKITKALPYDLRGVAPYGSNFLNPIYSDHNLILFLGRQKIHYSN